MTTTVAEPVLLAVANPAIGWLVHGLPWALAVVLFCLGAWWSRSKPAATSSESQPKQA